MPGRSPTFSSLGVVLGGCGTVQHEDHVDHLHDGHRHYQHGDHVHEHRAVSTAAVHKIRISG
ncbi:hypothetical protein E0H75_10700 [Kribbella capetownensis]|uniref:Uncharacterized protein n=1 Tax=Kribbella capetownensis TaxID=1572659 RepID=A0A4R0JWG0_9ACTN|nr:hypothetical protein E0H75_10700 [Kribbella capetownensis]